MTQHEIQWQEMTLDIGDCDIFPSDLATRSLLEEVKRGQNWESGSNPQESPTVRSNGSQQVEENEDMVGIYNLQTYQK